MAKQRDWHCKNACLASQKSLFCFPKEPVLQTGTMCTLRLTDVSADGAMCILLVRFQFLCFIFNNIGYAIDYSFDG